MAPRRESMSFATFWPTHRGLVTGGLRRCLVCGTERVDEQHPTFSAEAAPHATASLLRAGSAWWYALDVDILAGALDDADCRLFGGTGHVVVDGLAAPSWSALWPHEVVSLEGSCCAGCDPSRFGTAPRIRSVLRISTAETQRVQPPWLP